MVKSNGALADSRVPPRRIGDLCTLSCSRDKKDPKWPISSQTIRFLNVLGQLLESAKEMRPAKLKMMLKVLAIQSCNLMSAQRDDSRMSPQPSFFMAVINRVEQSQTAQRYRLTLSFPPSHWQIDGVTIKGDHDDEREPL